MKKICVFLAYLLIYHAVLAQQIQPANMPATGSSGTMHFQHFIFTVPAGWKAAEQNGLMVMFPEDLASNEMLSYVFLPAIDQSNSFESVAQSLLQQLASGFKGTLMMEPSTGSNSFPNLNKELSGKSFKGLEYYKGFGHMRIPLPNDPYSGEVYEINLFLVNVNSRMERVALLSKDVHDGVKQSTTYKNPKYYQTTREFCFSLDFDDWNNGSKPIGKITREGISSVWTGLNTYINGQSVVFTSTLQNTYLLFFDNGQVYFNSGFPATGLDDMNTLIEAEWNPHLWGTYTFQNGSGVIKLSYATMPFTLIGSKLVVNDMQANHDYHQIPPVDHAVFNGTWCGSGEVYGSSACIRFTTDGKFSDNGVVRALEHSLNDYYVATPPTGDGIYTIKNNSIIFSFNSGLVFKTAFTGENYQPGNENPKEISLGSSETKYLKN